MKHLWELGLMKFFMQGYFTGGGSEIQEYLTIDYSDV